MEQVEENSVEAFIDDGLKQKKVFDRLTEANNILIHKVFVQNKDGAELLAKWKNELVMQPSILPHYTQFEAGIAEGIKTFIRNIIIQSESVERDL